MTLRFLSGWIVLWAVGAAADDGFAFFEKEVRPLLAARCYECHSEKAGERKGGLWLDRKAGWEKGGDSGAAIVPGEPEKSLLLHAVRYLDEDLQMPPKDKLPAGEIAVLEKWIASGAADPRDESMAKFAREDAPDAEEARNGWAFRPHTNPKVPEVRNQDRVRDPIDAFILAEIEKRGLQAAGEAEPAALLRRLYFDLTGLPPTPEEVTEFQDKRSLETVVDDLLSRPAFGEKWGRHWLDVARYADSNGGDRNFTYFQAWRYRNYVIDSFNRDRSYYDFVRQQLAGDLMEAESDAERREQMVASTFLALGPKMLTERDKEKLWLDTADEQVDTMGRAFLGMTFGCARCHDHKFDPVSQEDYYAMAGIMRSTEVVTGTRNGCVNVASWVEQALPGAEEKDGDALAAKLERVELAMRLAVDKSFKKKAGGKTASQGLPLAGVLVDDTNAELVGEWKESKLFPNRFGYHYVHDDNRGKGERKVIFRGSLPRSGEYEVRVAYNGGDTRAKSVPVTVEARDGIFQKVLDQTKPPEVGGLFQPVGRFQFEKGGRVNVVISNEGTSGFVIVDAVQFIAVEEIDREAEALASMEVDPLLRMSEGEVKKELEKMLKELRTAEVVMAPRDAGDAGDVHLRVRGETSRPAEKIRRGFPAVLHDGSPPEIPEGQSGRLQLAEWITARDNALLDRVMVNRVWHHLFGRGIVRTVDNFGSIGAKPTHPELLDYLAGEFRASGGSVKSLVRRIVLSRTYGLSAGAVSDADPKNDFFTRQNRRRLTAEEIRDSVLFLSGKLDRTAGEGTAVKFGADLDKPMNFSNDLLRTVYLPVARNNLVPELAVFDAANPDLVSGARPATSVPTQALYLLNSGFFQSQAKALVERIDGSGEERIVRLYQMILNRGPSAEELQRALEFVRETSPSDLAHLLLVSTEFLFLE